VRSQNRLPCQREPGRAIFPNRRAEREVNEILTGVSHIAIKGIHTMLCRTTFILSQVVMLSFTVAFIGRSDNANAEPDVQGFRHINGDGSDASEDGRDRGLERDSTGSNHSTITVNIPSELMFECRKDLADGSPNRLANVGIDDGIAIAGGTNNSCGAGTSGCGQAFAYRFDTGGWLLDEEITPAEINNFDFYGDAVAAVDNLLNDPMLVVGAPGRECAAGNVCGAVYVHRDLGAGWTLEDKLVASDATSGREFGTALAATDQRILVGSPFGGSAGCAECGSAYIYDNESGWSETQILTASDASSGWEFGWAVDISGDVAVVTARGQGAYVFRWDGASWLEEQKLLSFDGGTIGAFGSSAAVDSGVIVIGARNDNCASGFCGAAYVYRYNGASWVAEKRLTGSNSFDGDDFGGSVDVLGSEIIVGASGADCSDGVDCGAAYRFLYDGVVWTESNLLAASDANDGDGLAGSMALGQSWMVAGAGGDDACPDPAQSDCGAVYFFSKTDQTVYVDASATGANDGSSWLDAFTNLHNAVPVATCDVWVANGVYMADGGYIPSGGSHVAGTGDRSDTFELRRGVAIYGGFDGVETSRDQRNANPNSNGCVLSADIDGNDIVELDGVTSSILGANSYHVVSSLETMSSAVLDGFAITGGQANGTQPFQNFGAGIRIQFGSPVVENCRLVKNSSTSVGGGISVEDGASPSIISCSFLGNTGQGGGAIWSRASNTSIYGCLFSGNESISNGGAIYNHSQAFLTGTTTIGNCTFSGNNAGLNGGGLYNSSAGVASVMNSVFWDNTDSGGNDEGGQIDARGGTVTIDFSCVQNGTAGFIGPNSITSDPLFLDPVGAGGVPGSTGDNLRLRSTSPCIDIGDNASVSAATDLDGETRIFDGTVDMGAYEYTGEFDTGACCLGDPNGGGQFGCSLLTQKDCSSLGGVFTGVGVFCVGLAPCSSTACCFGDSCSDISPAACSSEGGTAIGSGSCADFPCGEVIFDWVTVGNTGNVADSTGFGSVASEYRIARHEVTNYQYAQFLNAVAESDTNGLYNSSMGSDPRGGITQNGSLGNFSYSLKDNMANKPVNLVSFFDAMRFVNWLHNGQPMGDQDVSTTEDGVYTISDGLSENRAASAQFFIPTEDEWYKAAYHQPSSDGGDSDDYWLYPTASNSEPAMAMANTTGDISNPGPNIANHSAGAIWNFITGNVTSVGSGGSLSSSFYGTSDQGGNVLEWDETVISGTQRRQRGGTFQTLGTTMQSTIQFSDPPTVESLQLGFRVASPVPGPVPTVSEWGIVSLAILVLSAGTIVFANRRLTSSGVSN
jgi:formylglycine-generating enzyme required for sulfatase activity